ncbi:MAG: response regulator [Flavipsychrobacter sp.]|jgi:CheY-like chemotaxis protein|nr:response regulator [Flavipsychrobacter sp.]
MMDQEYPYILMLEDDEDDRYFTQTFFSDRGYNIGLRFLTVANDVVPYLQNCIENNQLLPRLILLDKNIPSVSGIEALRQVKQHPLFSFIPVVMISGNMFPKDINESYQLGVNSFIIKPHNSELTAKTIDAFVDYWFNVVELPEIKDLSFQPL